MLKAYGLILITLCMKLERLEGKPCIEFSTCTLDANNSNYGGSVYCNIVRYNSGTFINGGISLLRNVTDFKINCFLDILRGDNSKLNLLTVDINGCKFLDAFESNNNFLRLIIQGVRKHGTLPKKCPIPAGFVVSIENFTLSDELPLMIPRMTFVAKFVFMIKNRLEYEISVQGKIKPCKA